MLLKMFFPKCNSHLTDRNNSLSVYLVSATEEGGQNQEMRWFYGPFMFMVFDLKSPDSKDESLGWDFWLHCIHVYRMYNVVHLPLVFSGLKLSV